MPLEVNEWKEKAGDWTNADFCDYQKKPKLRIDLNIFSVINGFHFLILTLTEINGHNGDIERFRLLALEEKICSTYIVYIYHGGSAVALW